MVAMGGREYTDTDTSRAAGCLLMKVSNRIYSSDGRSFKRHSALIAPTGRELINLLTIFNASEILVYSLLTSLILLIFGINIVAARIVFAALALVHSGLGHKHDHA